MKARSGFPSGVETNLWAGQDCFDIHIASLPNGTQYEGIEPAVAGRITIRVMTGVELATVTLQGAKE